MSPSIVAPIAQIFKIALIGIGLTLKRDVAIGIASHGEHKQHLALLCRVDALMVNQLIADVNPMVDKENPQQIDCREAMEGQYRSPHNFHRRKVTTLFAIIHAHS